MEALLRALRTVVRTHPRLVIANVVVLTLAFAALQRDAVQSQGFENFAPDNAVSATFDGIAEEFATDGAVTTQVVLFAPEGGDVLSPAGVAWAAGLREQAATTEDLVPGLDQEQPTGPVFTFADVLFQAAQAQDLDVTTLDDAAIDQLFAGVLQSMPEQQRGRVVQSLASYDATTGTATAGAAVVFLDGDAPTQTLTDAHLAMGELEQEFDGYRVKAFDFELLSSEVNTAIQSQLGTLLGVAFLLIVLILIGIYRKASDVIASLLGLVFSIIWMQGLAVVLGPNVLGITGGMSEMSMVIPILLVGLGVDYGIHLTMRYREERGHGLEPGEAASGAIKAVGAALTLATITTVVGFLTNFTNPLPPLKDFGLFAAAGVVGAFLVMTTFVPAVRLVLDERAARRGTLRDEQVADDAHPGLLGRLAASFAPVATHRPWTVLGVAGVVTVIGTVAATGLSTEFSQTEFFPRDSEALQTINDVQDAFGGDLTETTQVLVTGTVDHPESLQALVDFETGLADDADVRTIGGRAQVDSARFRILQVLDAVAAAEGGAPQPGQDAAADPAAVLALVEQAQASRIATDSIAPDADVTALFDALLALDPSAAAVLSSDGAGGYDATLVAVSTSAGSDVGQLGDDLEADTAVLTGAGLDVGLASEGLLIDLVLGELRASQINSLVYTLVASMLILALVFWARERKPMLGVLAIAAVGIVVAWVLGIMAVVGIPFNVMTAMVSALAIGIGVPFGIHVVNRFLEDRFRYGTLDEAMRKTLLHTGGALVGSAVTTVAGFGVLAFATIRPMQQFGIVTALTIGLALISSILVLPAMLSLWSQRHDWSDEAEIHPERFADGAEERVPVGV